MKKARLIGFSLAALLVACGATSAAPPANDNCGSPQAIGPGTQNFDTTMATLDFTGDTCARTFGFGSPTHRVDVWYSYTPSITGTASISVPTCTNGRSVELTVHSNCSTQTFCEPDLCNGAISFAVTAGSHYLFRIATYQEFGGHGPGQFTITEIPPSVVPPNDNCTSATPITAGTYNFDTTLATPDYIDYTCERVTSGFGGGGVPTHMVDVWYNYTAAITGVATVQGVNCSDRWIQLTTHSDCTHETSCHANICTGSSPYQFEIHAGTHYLLRIGTYQEHGGHGRGTFQIVETSAPANDNCLMATPVHEGLNNWSTVGATTEKAECNSTGDVFYDFVAPDEATWEFSTVGSAFVPTMSLYTDCTQPSLGCIGVTSDSLASGTRTSRFMEPGEHIVIRLAVPLAYVGTLSGLLDIESNISPSNDTCGSALPVPVGTTAFKTTGAFVDDSSACGGTPDVFFSFAAPTAGYFHFDAANSVFSSFLSASSTCGGPELACTTSGGTGFALQLTSGQLIFLRVSGFGQGQNRGYGNLNITKLLDNDDCVGALPLVNGVAKSFDNTIALDGATANDFFFQDLWYSYTAPSNGEVHVEAGPTAGSTFRNGGLQIRNVCGFQYEQYLSVSASGTAIAAGTISVTAGQQIKIRVGNTVQFFGPARAPGAGTVKLTFTASCPADFNGDHVRDVADLFGYINAWLAKTSNADFNHDSVVDVADLFGFINAWLAGCP